MPTWGDSQRYSSTTPTRPGAQMSISPFSRRKRLDPHAVRSPSFCDSRHAGRIETGDFDKVPPDLRFFAGGIAVFAATNTNLSPRNTPTVTERGLEVDNRIAGVPVQRDRKWWGAVFVDSGEAVSDIRRSTLKPVPGSACAGNRRSGQSNRFCRTGRG